MGLPQGQKTIRVNHYMSSLKPLQILFSCSVKKSTGAKTRATLLRKIGAASVHKGINGFFLPHGDTYLGVFEGPRKKVLAQVEGLVRKEFVIALNVITECEITEATWNSWFHDSNELSKLSTPLIQRMAGLAQIIDDTLNAEQD